MPPLRPRPALHALLLIAVLPLLTVASPASAAPASRPHPVGWDRIARPATPAPVVSASGAVYVPAALRAFPTIEFDNHVADDSSVDMLSGALQAPLGSLRGAKPAATQTVLANVRINDTSADPPGSTQSETTIAALGLDMVAGWNDGKNFGASPGGTGYASSNDGGLTWTDGGVLPVPSTTALHEGDPVLTNDNAGHFYFGDLYTPDNHATSAIAVCHGVFSGGLISWNLPVMVASTTTDFLDKEWVAADKNSGRAYCTWTHFLAAGGNFIEFSTSNDHGATWSAPMALTSPSVESVQGSRIAVGPGGEVQVIYFVFDNASTNNYMRTRRSTTFGASWGPEVTLPTGPSGILSGYGSGPAGFNRAGGIGFPSLAIDRTSGANAGRVYATWEETVNFYLDGLAILGPISETENNNTPGLANPITIGQQVNGTLSSTADQDWFTFNGTAGETVVLYLASTGGADGFLRLFAGGGATANRTQLSYIGFGTGLCVYTCPYTGAYYFRVQANSANLGGYSVFTGVHTPHPGDEVGRDTRDVIFQSSPDGASWDTRRVINDGPALFDDAFPEVTVDAAGQVFVDWYDHRADPLGIGTDIRYSRSSNGGLNFAPSVHVNDGPSVNWNNVASNLAPNMGDYSALVADNFSVYANFADGRQGTPDSWLATIVDVATPTQLSFVRAQAKPDHVDLEWYAANGSASSAVVFRREADTAWQTLATIYADGTGRLDYRDTAVRSGASYEYRVGTQGATGMQYFGDTWVDVPAAALALERLRNPMLGSIDLACTLAGSDPATLQLFDVTGRAVESVRLTASGPVSLGSRGLHSGVYWVRLTQGQQSITRSAVFVRQSP